MRARVARAPEVAPELAGYPEAAPFATAPIEVTCRQGAQHYVARQVAYRQGRILFVDPRTSQLGIARLEGREGLDARQYPDARTAVLTFLATFGEMDPE
jgi:hypothetical protein